MIPILSYDPAREQNCRLRCRCPVGDDAATAAWPINLSRHNHPRP
jgi:hypothetical protein